MRTISRDELVKLEDRDDDYVLINVLDPESFRDKHIPGSINIPIDDERFLDKVRTHVGQKDRTIVVYCGSPKYEASQRAGEMLEQSGYTNVLRYKGGMSDWEEAGLRVDSEKISMH
jgi:rhodanese-related sulfurtransferase